MSIQILDIPAHTGTPHVGILSHHDLAQYQRETGLVLPSHTGGTSHYDSHEHFDLISLFLPSDLWQGKESVNLMIYLDASRLLFVTDHAALQQSLSHMLFSAPLPDTLSALLYRFFDALSRDDFEAHRRIESELEALEESLLEDRQKNITRQIAAYRRLLLTHKRYYEQLLDLMEDLEENQNNLIDHKTLRSFHLLTGRISRLYQNTVNLRDYVTQVREAYQAQTDIQLNRLMKLFTVLTAIFSPLTLLVGWYGMNFPMPEFRWAFGYPFVILLSVIIVGFCIVIFKKKRWF